MHSLVLGRRRPCLACSTCSRLQKVARCGPPERLELQQVRELDIHLAGCRGVYVCTCCVRPEAG